MGPRRAVLMLAVVVAATAGVGATATRAAGTAGAGVVHAAAAKQICVALVVDGRAIGSNVSTSCAKVSKGASGVDVLRAAGHTLTFRNDGLLCTIDGLPKTGCSDVDDSHYWAYFHRAPGSTRWTYGTEGPSTYQPSNNSTDGWVYDNGTSRTPKGVPYSHICTTKPAPKPSPSPTRTHHRSPRPTPTPTRSVASPSGGTHHHTAPRRSPSPSASATHHPSHRVAPHSSRGRHHHRHPGQPSHPPAHAVAPGSPAPSSTTAALVGGTPSGGSSHRGLLGLVIGLVLVGGLGGLTAYRFRRSS